MAMVLCMSNSRGFSISPCDIGKIPSPSHRLYEPVASIPLCQRGRMSDARIY